MAHAAAGGGVNDGGVPLAQMRQGSGFPLYSSRGLPRCGVPLQSVTRNAELTGHLVVPRELERDAGNENAILWVMVMKKVRRYLEAFVEALGSGVYRTVQWIKSIPSTSLRSKHFFYLNRLSPRLWIVIGLAVYVVVKIQVAYPNTALIPSIGLKLMLSMGQSMISAFIFFVIVHHYTTHAKRDKEHRQLASDLYDVLLSSCSFLHIPDEKLRTYVPKDFQRTLYELEDKIEKGDKDGLDVLRHKAQRDLLLCLMGLYRVSRYSLDHDFDAKLNEAIYHLRIVVDPSPQYDRDTYRLTVCRYYTALSELIDEYGYDYSKRGHVVLTKRSYMQRRNVFYEPI